MPARCVSLALLSCVRGSRVFLQVGPRFTCYSRGCADRLFHREHIHSVIHLGLWKRSLVCSIISYFVCTNHTPPTLYIEESLRIKQRFGGVYYLGLGHLLSRVQVMYRCSRLTSCLSSLLSFLQTMENQHLFHAVSSCDALRMHVTAGCVTPTVAPTCAKSCRLAHPEQKGRTQTHTNL